MRAAVGLLIAVALLAAADSKDLARLFAYGAGEPLNLHVEERDRVSGAEVQSISYLGGRAPVTAALVVPAETGRHPAVIFVNDGGHRRDYFVAEAVKLANAHPPAVSLLIDAPPVRPPGWRRSFNAMLAGNDEDIHIQAAIDARRGIDVLAARADVDARSIAFVGQSDGARWGAILAAVEPRLRALVLISASPNLTTAELAEDPEWADLRYGMGPERFQQYVDSLAAVDPVLYLSPASAPILFQFGRFDPYISRARADVLVRAAGRSGQARFYVCGHEVNAPEALADRVDFLAAHIGVGKR